MAEVEKLKFKAKGQSVIVLPNGQSVVANKAGDTIEVPAEHALFMASRLDAFEPSAAAKKAMAEVGVTFADLVKGEGDGSGDPFVDSKDADSVREASNKLFSEQQASTLAETPITTGPETMQTTNWPATKGPLVKTNELDTETGEGSGTQKAADADSPPA